MTTDGASLDSAANEAHAEPKASSGRPPSMPPAGAGRAIGKRPRMVTFLRVLLTATAVSQLFAALGAAEGARRLGLPSPALFGIGLYVLGVGTFAARARVAMSDRRRTTLEIVLLDLPNFIHWCACIYCLVPGLLVTLLAPIVDLARGVPVHLPMGAYLWIYGTGLLVCGYGVLVRRRAFVVRRVDVPVRGLDPRLEGFTIAHLSDLHIGAMTPKSWGFRWAEAANEASPDAAVVTGDMVTSGTAFHEDIAEVVGKLRAKHGVFVCMGNHDYFGEGEPLVSLLRERGARVLLNEGETLEHAGGRLHLAGIDDTWTRRDDMLRALAGRPAKKDGEPGVPTVLLAHDPERFLQAKTHGVEVTLSGHTHGGQIAVPFLGKWLSLSHLTHHFHVGLYRDGDAALYVHPGLGTTGPPMRLGVAPAVVLLKLRAA